MEPPGGLTARTHRADPSTLCFSGDRLEAQRSPALPKVTELVLGRAHAVQPGLWVSVSWAFHPAECRAPERLSAWHWAPGHPKEEGRTPPPTQYIRLPSPRPSFLRSSSRQGTDGMVARDVSLAHAPCASCVDHPESASCSFSGGPSPT